MHDLPIKAQFNDQNGKYNNQCTISHADQDPRYVQVVDIWRVHDEHWTYNHWNTKQMNGPLGAEQLRDWYDQIVSQ